MSDDTSQDAEGRTPEPEGTPEARYRVVGYVLYDPEAGAYIGRDGMRGRDIRHLQGWPRMTDAMDALILHARRTCDMTSFRLRLHRVKILPGSVVLMRPEERDQAQYFVLQATTTSGRVRYLAPYPVGRETVVPRLTERVDWAVRFVAGSSLSELLEEARRIGRHCIGVHALALMPVQVLPDVTLTEEVV